MIFPDVFEPTKINFEIRNIEPATRHYFDDGFEVRIAKTSTTEIVVNFLVEGANDLEVKVLMDFYRTVRGNTNSFIMNTEGIIFRNHPHFKDWVSVMYNDPDNGEQEIKWYFEGKPRVKVVSVGTYEVEWAVKSWRRLFPNSRVSVEYLS